MRPPHNIAVATEQNLPRSIPMTEPLIFLSPSSDFRTNVDENGLRRRVAERVAGEEVRGSCRECEHHAPRELRWRPTALEILEANMVAGAERNQIVQRN